MTLNDRAHQLCLKIAAREKELRVASRDGVLDFGVETSGGLQAGLELARVCLSDLADVSLTSAVIGDLEWPHVQVSTDHPVDACLLSQYAGWKFEADSFFGMGSGPMRLANGREELIQSLADRESAERVVGVLECETRPPAAVVNRIAERTGVSTDKITLCVAPTASQAGTLQIVARSVETALHKLHELEFDVRRVRSAFGIAPLPPVGANFLGALGRTNDAILYGGRVTLWVTGDDESISAIGASVPANSSPSHGQPFQKIFQAAGGDFYKIDPNLFSPAVVVFQNLETGRAQRFGEIAPEMLRISFGLE